jgi:adenine-specific DNA-methyltransferase
MSIEKLKPSFHFEAERIEQLKQIAPEAFADGKIIWENLQEALGDFIDDENTDTEHFGLFWPGKREARKIASTPSLGTLIPCPGEGIDEETTKNIFIEGENLEVLKLLQKSYANQVKLIYIDPPYNTGSDFVYNDNFNDSIDDYLVKTGQVDDAGKSIRSNPKSSGRYHSNWLTLMYSRLRLSRNLLLPEGVIFISIDNNEIHNLRLIMDELFGEENFVGIFIWRKKSGGGQTDEFFVTEHEYLVVYRKSNEFVWGDEKFDDNISAFPNSDAKGNFKLVKLAKWGSGARRADRPTMHFPILAPDNTEVLPIAPDKSPGRWRVGFKTMNILIDKELIHFEKKNDEWLPYEKIYFDEEKKKTNKIRSILYDVASTGDGTNELTNIFKVKDVFDNPKPVKLIYEIIKHNINEGDIVLDFFAGSGTTGHTVFKLICEDDKDIQFVLIQLQELLSEKSVAFSLGYKHISDITKDRLKKVSSNLKKEKEYINKDLGFKTYKLQHSNYKPWKNYTGTDIKELENLFENNTSPLVDNWKHENLLSEILLIEGFPLHSKIEEIDSYNKNKIVKVSSDFCEHKLLVCLDDNIDDNTIKSLELSDKDIFICLDNAISDKDKVTLQDKGLIKTI